MKIIMSHKQVISDVVTQAIEMLKYMPPECDVTDYSATKYEALKLTSQRLSVVFPNGSKITVIVDVKQV